MADSTQKSSNPHLLQSTLLVVIETIVDFIIKYDKNVQSHADFFIQHRYTVQFNLFLPDFRFYLTFDPKGLLFDLDAPKKKQIHFIVNSTCFDLIQMLFLGREGSLRRIRYKGEDEHTELFRHFLRSLSLPMLLANWKNWFRQDSKQNAPLRSVQPLIKRIEQQRSQITTLTVKNKQFKYELSRLKNKVKLLHYAYISVIILLVIAIISIICYYH